MHGWLPWWLDGLLGVMIGGCMVGWFAVLMFLRWLKSLWFVGKEDVWWCGWVIRLVVWLVARLVGWLVDELIFD